MRVAVQGCGHGNLNAIYRALHELEMKSSCKADLLLVCGDFQALRHNADLDTLACPTKYRRLGDFPDYFEGRRVAPLPTIFIGGNHEASRHMSELYYGGWVAPNIYFLGQSGAVRFGELRLVGISGLYSKAHYDLGYFERPPYNHSTLRSIYHTRRTEVDKLAMVKTPIDVFLSHEWPRRIYEHGDLAGLLRCKPFFRQDIEGEGIGAPPLADLLHKLRPRHWFSAHMHVEFEAEVSHPDGSTTQFLALDKCIPNRRHLRIIDLPHLEGGGAGTQLEYDPEWLAIVKATHPFLSFTRTASSIPADLDRTAAEEFVAELQKTRKDGLIIPKNYMKPADRPGRRTTLRQTAEFCRMMQITNYWGDDRPPSSKAEPSTPVFNEDEIKL